MSFEQVWNEQFVPIWEAFSSFLPVWLLNSKALSSFDIWIVGIPGYLCLRNQHSKWVQSSWLHPVPSSASNSNADKKKKLNPSFYTFTLPLLALLSLFILALYLLHVYFQNEFIHSPTEDIISSSSKLTPGLVYSIKKKLVLAKQNHTGSPNVDWSQFWDPVHPSTSTATHFNFSSLDPYEFESLLFLDYHIGYDFRNVAEFLTVSGSHGRWVYLAFLICDTFLSWAQWAFHIQLILLFYGSSLEEAPSIDSSRKKSTGKKVESSGASPEQQTKSTDSNQNLPFLAILFALLPTILCFIELYENLGHGLFIFHWSWSQLMSNASFQLSKQFVHRVMTASSWKFSLCYLLLGIHVSGYVRKSLE